jgi:hypothetical protein
MRKYEDIDRQIREAITRQPKITIDGIGEIVKDEDGEPITYDVLQHRIAAIIKPYNDISIEIEQRKNHYTIDVIAGIGQFTFLTFLDRYMDKIIEKNPGVDFDLALRSTLRYFTKERWDKRKKAAKQLSLAAE